MEICKHIAKRLLYTLQGRCSSFAIRCVAYEVRKYVARDVCKFCLAMLKMHAAQNILAALAAAVFWLRCNKLS